MHCVKTGGGDNPYSVAMVRDKSEGIEQTMHRLLLTLGLLVYILTLAACTTIQQVEPLPTTDTLTISPASNPPKTVPKGLYRFEDSPFVFVHADHSGTLAVDMLIPVPFVTGAVMGSVQHRQDKARQESYLSIDAYALLEEKMAGYEHFRSAGGEYMLHVLIPMEECIDDVYRLSLMFQLERDDWMGRYHYHLPTTIPTKDIGDPTTEELATFKQELAVGFDKLMSIIEKEISGDYDNKSAPVTLGSLYIVGGSIGGLVNPEIFKVKNAIELESNQEEVVVRVPGNPRGEANNGGMAFGVHAFRRDQLHTYELEN